MAFWGVEVKPGKPFTHKADDAGGRLHISQATLGIGTATKKTVVQCNVGNKSPVFLCSLFPEKTESCQLNLEFEEADEVVFSVIGPRSVHLTGYFLATSSRRYNLNDESESYGEDIADTETERSTGHSDEDKYEDSFINDSDPEVFRPSPVSDGGVLEMDRMLDRRKPKKAMGSNKRSRKTYQLSESDDDIDAQKQTFTNGSATVAILASDNEDNIPIFSLCKGDPNHSENFKAVGKDVSKSDETNTATEMEVEEKADKLSGETSNGGAKIEVNRITMSERKSDAVVNGEPKRSYACDSILFSSEMVPENGIKPKKKKKVQAKKVKHLDNDGYDCSDVHLEDQATQSDTKANKMVQNLPFQNEENQKTFNHVEGVDLPPDFLLPSTQVGSEKHARPKKRKIKVRPEERVLEVDNVDHTNVEKADNTLKDEMKPDSTGEDLPETTEQNEKQVNDNEGVDLPHDSLPPSTQVGSEKDLKPKKSKVKKHDEEKVFEADSVDHADVEKENKAIQDGMKLDSIGQDLPKGIEQNEKQVNDKISDNDVNQSVAELQPEEKKKKKKKKRRTEDGKVMKTEKPLLFLDAENGSVMDTENTRAEVKLSQLRTLPNGLVIQELVTGKPDGKVAASGKKISVHYTGKLKENGQVFDSNLGSTPLKFHLGRKGVIEGLNVGLEGMRVGEKRRLLVPPSMGYGNEGDDGMNIPPNSWLEFDVELVKVHR